MCVCMPTIFLRRVLNCDRHHLNALCLIATSSNFSLRYFYFLETNHKKLIYCLHQVEPSLNLQERKENGEGQEWSTRCLFWKHTHTRRAQNSLLIFHIRNYYNLHNFILSLILSFYCVFLLYIHPLKGWMDWT